MHDGRSGDNFVTRCPSSRCCDPLWLVLRVRLEVRFHRCVSEVCFCILRAWSWSYGIRHNSDLLASAWARRDISLVWNRWLSVFYIALSFCGLSVKVFARIGYNRRRCCFNKSASPSASFSDVGKFLVGAASSSIIASQSSSNLNIVSSTSFHAQDFPLRGRAQLALYPMME